MKFEKPFSSFLSHPNYKGIPTLKERWKLALHDPAYLIIMGGSIAFLIYYIIILS
jgi:hypothetical protein